MRKALIFILSLPIATAWAETADVLEYQVHEAGSPPYTSRFLVTPRWLRLDQGEGSDGYLLYDRRTGVIHDVSDEDRTVLEIDPPRAGRSPPQGMRLEIVPIADPEAPTIAGIAPRHYRLRAGGGECQEIVVLPGVMDSAVKAWREFIARLADQQALELSAGPSAGEDACDLLTHVYAPEKGLKLGLPVFWHIPRKDRALQDYAQDRKVDDALFRLPKGYRRMGLPQAANPPPASSRNRRTGRPTTQERGSRKRRAIQ